MKGNSRTGNTSLGTGPHLGHAPAGNLLQPGLRLLVVIALLISFRDLSAPRHDPMLLIVGIYTACQLTAVIAWRHRGNDMGRWLFTAILDTALIAVITTQAEALPSWSLTPLPLLAGLSMTGPNWRANLLAGFSMTSLVAIAAVTGPEFQKHPAWILSYLGWLPLLLIFALNTREYHQLRLLVPGPDEVPGLNNRVTLDYAARFFIPYQQRNLTPISLAAIRLVAKEKLNKPARRNLYRLNERRLASIFEMRLRKCDVAVRISADTYALLLPDCDADGGMTVVREIQAHFADWVRENSLNSHTVACIIPLPNTTTAMAHLATNLEMTLRQLIQAVPSPDNMCFFASDPSALP